MLHLNVRWPRVSHAIPIFPRREETFMRRKLRTRKPNRQKTKLGLPDLEHVKSAVLVSLRSPESQRRYRRSIDDFVCWYRTAAFLQQSRSHPLQDSSRRQAACTWHHQREACSSQTSRL